MKKKILIALSLILLILPLSGCKKETVVTDNYQKALELIEERSYTEAMSYLEKASEENPSDSKTYLEIAKIYKLKGLYDKAIETLNIGEENAGKNKDLSFLKGEIYFIKKDYDSALTAFQTAKEENYGDAAIIKIGKTYIKKSSLNDAKTAFSEVKDSSDYYSEANYYLAVLNTNDINAATDYLSKVQDTENSELNSNKSTLTTLFNEIKEKASIETTNENYLALLKGYSLIKVDQFEIAKTIIEPVATHYEDEGKPSYQANFYLGSIYYHLEDYNNAKSELLTSIVANPTDPITLHLLGLTYSKLKDQVNSIESFEKALVIDPNAEICRYDFVKTLVSFKINSKAEDNFKELIKLDTDNKEQYQLEFAQFQNDINNKASEAETLTSTLINEWGEFSTSSDETQAEIYDAYGYSLYLQDKTEESLTALNKAVELDKISASVNYHLGKVYEKKEDYDKAIEYYSRAVDLSFDASLSEKANQDYERLTK